MYISLVKYKPEKYMFNLNNFWPNSFWSKVHLRILMLMKQIFIETKKHNVRNVYRLQNYLINSNELKISELNKIIQKVCLSYYKKEKKKHILDNSLKLNLINNAFNIETLKNEDYIIIKTQLKENLILASIEPVHKARSTKFIHKSKSLKFSDGDIIKYCVSNKYIIKKLVQYNQMKKFILNLLKKNHFFNVLEIFYSKNIFNLKQPNYILYVNDIIENTSFINLMHQIISIDTIWYSFNETKKNQYTTIINLPNLFTVYTQYISFSKVFKIYLRSFFSTIKSKIYKYVFIKTSYNSLFYKLINLCESWYYKIKPFISINIIHICYKYINNIIYIWTKRKILQKDTDKIVHKMNSILNRFIYLCNLNKYCIY
uniref:Reverse transcriptase N-terminal domain-containing protein n=1 Tax=Vertebrata thuyoides TaxID=2006970 RepID=A0A1Z1MB39_9FLOR|nr:hypothetical protein [Vertebrata thuyoides]ARW63092.1 hypothetical protein [Vertebrata thuyoides]